MKLRAIVLSVFLLVAPTSDAQSRGPEHFWNEISSCTQDSDCRSATEIWPACNHVCGKYEHENCATLNRICPALSKTSDAMPDCAVNAPCIAPRKIWCENGHCKSA